MARRDDRWSLDHDWYPGGVPGNVEVGPDVFLDSAYGFTAFLSDRDPGLTIGEASGAYDRATFVVGPQGRVSIGGYTVVNGTYVVCERRVTIGAHGLLSWGTVITDVALDAPASLAERRAALAAAAQHPERHLVPPGEPRPTVLEDNVWVGFGSVVGPGVTVGRGAIVGSKTVVRDDVPAYAVVVGDPARVVRALDPTDTAEARRAAFAEYVRPTAHGNVRQSGADRPQDR